MGVRDNFRYLFSSTFEPFEENEEERSEVTQSSEDPILTAFFGGKSVTKEQALTIPTIDSALNLIKGTVRGIQLKLYRKKENGAIEEIQNDRRTFLFNVDTGDTLNAGEMRDALIEDYYLYGAGWLYVERDGNEVKSLRYVDKRNVAIQTNEDPIFKDYDVWIDGKKFYPFNFMRILRNSRDGATGEGILARNELLLRTAYNSLKFENDLVSKGGNKKGFLKSPRKLGEEAMAKLKQAWKKLYTSNEENVVILNEGLEFQESSASSVELQLNENKKTNSEEMCKLFNIPFGMLGGTGTSAASEDDKIKFVDYCIVPLLDALKSAANRDLLLEKEKGEFFFEFDKNEIKKGKLLERYQAYAIALKNNIMSLDAVRKAENQPELGYDFINLNLGQVLYSVESGQGFVPNTGERFDMTDFFKKEGKKENES